MSCVQGRLLRPHRCRFRLYNLSERTTPAPLGDLFASGLGAPIADRRQCVTSSGPGIWDRALDWKIGCSDDPIVKAITEQSLIEQSLSKGFPMVYSFISRGGKAGDGASRPAL